jgi:hypothetical protein
MPRRDEEPRVTLLVLRNLALCGVIVSAAMYAQASSDTWVWTASFIVAYIAFDIGARL